MTSSALSFSVFKWVSSKSTTIWDITPCSRLKANRHFGRTYRVFLQGRRIYRTRYQRESRWQEIWICLASVFTLVSCSAYSSTFKMEAVCSPETSIDFQRTTRLYIPEDSTLHIHCGDNLKSYMFLRIRQYDALSVCRMDSVCQLEWL
jgi:hypothetical protein